MAARRRFGRVRCLPSGQYQARYHGPDGVDRPAPRTFGTKKEAEVWLVTTEAEIRADQWLNPDEGQVAFAEFAEAWIDERTNLRPSTVEVYRYVLRRHLIPALGLKPVAAIREPHVRRWRKELLDSGASPTSVAKAYRLLKAVLNTAVDDGIIRRNPCRISGAGQDRSPERRTLTVRQVGQLATATHPRYRALVLLAVFGSLRWGELAALRRRDLDLERCTVKVERSLTELPGGGFLYGPPKSSAGARTVAFPDLIRADLVRHLAAFTAQDEDALVFTSPAGGPLRHGNFRRRYWLPALARCGLTGTHFHDLRHTGNMLTAGTGATLRELMDRMGHSSTRAAMIYLHGSDDRQRQIAASLSKLAGHELKGGRKPPRNSGNGTPTGTQRARRDTRAS